MQSKNDCDIEMYFHRIFRIHSHLTAISRNIKKKSDVKSQYGLKSHKGILLDVPNNVVGFFFKEFDKFYSIGETKCFCYLDGENKTWGVYFDQEAEEYQEYQGITNHHFSSIRTNKMIPDKLANLTISDLESIEFLAKGGSGLNSVAMSLVLFNFLSKINVSIKNAKGDWVYTSLKTYESNEKDHRFLDINHPQIPDNLVVDDGMLVTVYNLFGKPIL